MNKSAQFTPGPWHLEHDVDGIPLTIIGSDGSAIGTVETWNDCTEGNRLVLTAAPVMYDRHKDNHGMVQEALRFLYEGEYEEVKCLLNHIALNSKKAVKQAEGRHHE